METLFLEATKTDLLQWGLILFIILGGGTATINSFFKNKLGIKKNRITLESHEECNLYPDHIEAVVDAEKNGYITGKEETHIREHVIVYEQMALIETSAERVISSMVKAFDEKIQSINLPEEEYTATLNYYSEIAEGAIGTVIGYLRKWIKRNHFIEMSDVDFQTYYIPSRLKDAADKVTTYLNHRHLTYILKVTKQERMEINNTKVFPEIEKEFTTMFFKIREVSELYHEEISSLKEKLVYEKIKKSPEFK